MKLASPEVRDERNHLLISFATLFLVLISVVILPMSPQRAYQLDLSDGALRYAAQVSGVPLDQLAIANTAWLGNEIFRAKVLDKATGEIYVVSVHSPANRQLTRKLPNSFVLMLRRALSES